MLTLAIDTSTNTLSIALVRDDEVLASIDEQTKNNQSEILMSRIETMINDCGLKPADLEKIVVAIGPGSYTGIRVGVAAAKSLAYALDIPIVGISSLEVMAMAAVSSDVRFRIPMIDARRKTVFAGVYGADGTNIISDGHDHIEQLIEALIPTLVEGDTISFIGDGAAVHKEILLEKWPEAGVITETHFKRCKGVVLAELSRKRSPIKDIHRVIPNYLRKTEAEMNAGV